MPVRRRRLRRRPRPPRFPWLALFGVAIVIAVVWWGASALKRQFAGYFEQARSPHAAAHPGARPRAGAPQAVRTEAPVAPPLVGASGPLAQPHPPRIAIIIDDCGNNLPKDEQFLPLPATLTLAILPLSKHGRDIAQEAQAAGKAIMLHLPMQPVSSEHNPGPGAITTAMTDRQIAAQIEEDLTSLPPVAGGNNHMGSKGTADPRVMHDVLVEFKAKHLFFIDSETSNASLGAAMARELGVQTAARDVFLDNAVDEPSIEAQLRDAERLALAHGQAIAIGHPFPETAKAIAKLIPEMKAAGIELVAAETLVH
jgi:polysaccharide deacetylase 2 family uncharacterized protein YibQ